MDFHTGNKSMPLNIYLFVVCSFDELIEKTWNEKWIFWKEFPSINFNWRFFHFSFFFLFLFLFMEEESVFSCWEPDSILLENILSVLRNVNNPLLANDVYLVCFFQSSRSFSFVHFFFTESWTTIQDGKLAFVSNIHSCLL